MTADYGADGKVQSIHITDQRGIPQTLDLQRNADGRSWEMTSPNGEKKTVQFVHIDPHGGLHFQDTHGHAYIRDLHGQTKQLNNPGHQMGGPSARG
jgi:hypothetical protein